MRFNEDELFSARGTAHQVSEVFNNYDGSLFCKLM